MTSGRALATGLVVVFAVSALTGGCARGDGATVAQANQYVQGKTRSAMPAPRTTADMEKLGLPVFKGSVIAEGEDSTTVTERSFTRTYYAKLFSPASVADVSAFYMHNLKTAQKTGVDDVRIVGKNALGDDVEVLLGQAADHKRALVMAWLSQSK